MPIVPEVDIHRARHANEEQSEIHAEANRDDESPHRARISDGGGGGPAEVEIGQVESVMLNHPFESGPERGCQKCRDDTEPDKAHAHEKP